MGKKAISPLAATIILIAFSVAIGVSVMSIGINLGSRQKTNETTCMADECEAVQLQFYSSASQKYPPVSIKDNQLSALLENNGKKDISKVIVRVVTGSEIQNNMHDWKIRKGELYRASAEVMKNNGSSVQIELVPMIESLNRGLIPCSAKALKYTP